MFSYLDFLFLSYHGRIGRGAYWLGTLVVLIAEIGAIAFLLKLSHGSLADLAAARREAGEVSRAVLVHVIVPVMIVSLLFLYPTYALCEALARPEQIRLVVADRLRPPDRRPVAADRTGVPRRRRGGERLRRSLNGG